MKFKNLYLRDNFLFIFSLFPIFILKSNFSLEEYFLALSIFFLLFLVNFFLINYFKNKKLYILNIIYLSFIITYGIDNLVGLHNALIAENLDFLKRIFFIIYIHSVILFFIIFILIFFSFKKFDNKKLKIIYIVFILSLFSFNLIDDTKSYKKINMYDKNSDQIFNNKTVILILDEMSGLNSLSSSTKSGKIFNNYAENFFKEHNFTYYTNSFSISQNSGSSISSLLNFGDYTEKHLRDKVLKKSANYFYEYDLVENKLFKNFKSISIFQNIHINYCKNKNINKCYTYNPFELDKLKVEVDFFSKYISLWHLNGSIVSKILWKLTKMFGLITSIVEPDGQKVFIKEI